MQEYPWIEDQPRRLRLLSVAGLLRLISSTFSREFGQIRITGEIRSVKTSGPGHVYMDIKDCHEEAQIQACLFRNVRMRVSYLPKVGDVIEATGELNIYPPRGSMSLVISDIRPAGSGDLYAQFLALKEKLAGEGLFAQERKKPLPEYPLTVGVVTSAEAAALRDVIKTIRLLAPHVSVILYPSSVQGEGSERELIEALKVAEERHEVDVMLLVRGGGSLTDLWTFNSEALARTIASMTIPIVSGVGHETDITIADMVSDFRAATPTAAAETAVRAWKIAKDRILGAQQQMLRVINARLHMAKLQLKAVGSMDHRVRFFLQTLNQRLSYGEDRLAVATAARVRQNSEKIEGLKRRLSARVLDFSLEKKQLETLHNRMIRAVSSYCKFKQLALNAASERLKLLDTRQVLERGFVIATNARGDIVRDGAKLCAGDTLKVHFSDSVAQTRVESVTSKPSQ